MIELFENYQYLQNKYQNSKSIVFKSLYAKKIEKVRDDLAGRLGIKDFEVENLININRYYE